MERETLVELMQARVALRDLTKPPQELIEEISKESAAGFEITNNHQRERIKGILSKSKIKFIELYGIKPSRPLLVSSFLIEGLEHDLDQIALGHFSAGRYQEFALIFDMGQGIGFVAGSVPVAESEISGNLSTDLSSTMEEFSRISPDVPTNIEQSDAYQSLFPLAATYARELEKDPTGFGLVDFVADDLDKNWDKYPAPNFKIKEIFMVGVRTSQTMYKAIYPLTENLSS